MPADVLQRHKTLRIYISNTADNQPWQAKGLDENAFDFSTGSEATYRVKIRGRLLEDEDDSDDSDEGDGFAASGRHTEAMDHDGADGPPKSKRSDATAPRERLSHFFKSITVDFDRPKGPQSDAATQIEWKKPPVTASVTELPASADFDVLEFERKGDESLNCTISLVPDESPERYRLSKELAEVLDTEEEDRAGVVMGIWQYVKAMGLQEDEERRGIRCDDRLRAVWSPLAPSQLQLTLSRFSDKTRYSSPWFQR